MSDSAGRILFIPQHGSSLVEMLPVAERIKAENRYQPLFFLYKPTGRTSLQLLEEKHIPAIGKYARGESVPGTRSPKPKKLSGVKRISKGIQRWLPVRFVLDYLNYLRLRRKARDLLVDRGVQALITIGDRHVGWETALIYEGKQMGIPCLIVPYAMSDPDVPATYRLRQIEERPDYAAKGWLPHLVLKHFPDWSFEFHGQELLYLPLGSMLAAQAVGIMPAKPWTLGGGVADRMAVENQVLEAMFQEQGVRSEKMFVTGKPSVDQIYQTVQSVDLDELREQHGLADDLPVITCAVPHLGEHDLLPFDEHLREVKRLFQSLSHVPNSQILLSLHPKSDPSHYRPLAEESGAVIGKRRIYELLPLSTIFVAGFSSTVMNAIGLYIPTVVVDFYGLDHHFFDDAPGTILLKDPTKLVSTLVEILEDREFYEKLQNQQKEFAGEWVLLDGQCTRRVVDHIYDLAGTKG